MNTVEKHWKKVKEFAAQQTSYTLEETKTILLNEGYYRGLGGKAKNRTLLKEDPKLYKSIYDHTYKLEVAFKTQKSWYGSYNFYKRVLFIVEKDSKLENLKCKCGKKYTWTQYCRLCPDYKKNQLGKSHTEETKLKMRLSTLSYLESLKGQLAPRYNRDSISLIEKYGEQNGYRFMHAENGGEYFIKELGYFVDAYDPVMNVVLEIDEKHHYGKDGELIEKDRVREREIKKLLRCKFIRIKYDRV